MESKRIVDKPKGDEGEERIKVLDDKILGTDEVEGTKERSNPDIQE
jgi:hypothetical protein